MFLKSEQQMKAFQQNLVLSNCRYRASHSLLKQLNCMFAFVPILIDQKVTPAMG